MTYSEDVEPDLDDLNDDDSVVPDEEPQIEGESPRPIEDPVMDFPDTGDDSHADDDVEDPDVLDDDSEAVG